MKTIQALSLVLAASCFALPAMAQTSAQKKPTTSKSAAKPAAKSPAKPSAQTPATPAAAAATLSSEQLSIAQIVETGTISCADGQKVKITADAKTQGAFDLQFGSSKFDVVPIPTKSGAIRLEDSKTGVVYMQLANKSMLFNERQGRRLADDCISPSQQAVADNMKANPTAGVLDGPAK